MLFDKGFEEVGWLLRLLVWSDDSGEQEQDLTTMLLINLGFVTHERILTIKNSVMELA